MKRLLIIFAGLVLVVSARAASFDCAKAGTKVERLICADPEISKLDDGLAASYKAALQNQSQAEEIRQSEKLWILLRNDCTDAGCIKKSYEDRLSFFKSLTSIPMTPSVEKYDNDYVRDLNAKTYLPAHVDRQEGEPYQAARDPHVCSLFLQNLQYFARRNIPMSCGQPIAPGLEKYIQKVEWEDLDPDRYQDLFKETVKQFDYGKEPNEQVLVKARNFVRNKRNIFRRAKLDMKGRPSFSYPYGAKPAEAKFNLIQYGMNVTDLDNPDTSWRCEMQQGRKMKDGEYIRLFIATEDLQKLYWNSIAVIYGSGQNLWLINGYPYSEWYDEDGTVRFSELRLDALIHFEPVCLYRYKTNLTNKGAAK